MTHRASLSLHGLPKTGGTRVYPPLWGSTSPWTRAPCPPRQARRPWQLALGPRTLNPGASLSPQGLSKTGGTWVYPSLRGFAGPWT